MAKKGNKGNKNLLIGIGVVIILLIVGILVFSGGGETKASQASVDTFAQCLTNNGATMYGTFWCPHCAQTKKRFGSSFQYINYVECDARGDNEQSLLCIEKGIDSYDTWEFTDGSRVVGEPSFATLAEKTGCEAPQ